jgi:DNA invertase Pin-like site-specific DNA recombinase
MNEPYPYVELLILKVKTRQEVADEFGINVRTLSRWLKRANIDVPRGLIKPSQLRLIYENFGVTKLRKD